MSDLKLTSHVAIHEDALDWLVRLRTVQTIPARTEGAKGGYINLAPETEIAAAYRRGLEDAAVAAEAAGASLVVISAICAKAP